MGVTLASDTDTVVSGGTSSYKIVDIISSGDPFWRKKSRLRRTWKPTESLARGTRPSSLFYVQAYDDFTSSVYSYETDNPSAAYSIFPLSTRITYINPGVGTDQDLLTIRDRGNLLAHIRANNSSSSDEADGDDGPTGTLIETSSPPFLADWYYPDPTHVQLSPRSGGLFLPMTSAPATNSRAYVQRFLRQPDKLSAYRQGIGGYPDSDGLRLIQSQQNLQQYWIRPGTPILPLIPFHNGSAFNEGKSSGSFYHSAYGLPDYVELSGSGTVPTGSPVPNLLLLLYQNKADGSATGPTTVATVAASFDHTAGGLDYYILQPTDSGYVATLDSDTLTWYFLVGTDATGGGVGGFAWHKLPCHVQPYAISSVVDGASAYLPGWLYDPYA